MHLSIVLPYDMEADSPHSKVFKRQHEIQHPKQAIHSFYNLTQKCHHISPAVNYSLEVS